MLFCGAILVFLFVLLLLFDFSDFIGVVDFKLIFFDFGLEKLFWWFWEKFETLFAPFFSLGGFFDFEFDLRPILSDIFFNINNNI